MANDAESLRDTTHLGVATRIPVATNPVGGAAKRVLDIVVSLTLLVFLMPLLLALTALVWAQGDGPVFYRQNRIGFDGVEFPCLKFRSMVADAQQRLTKLLETDLESRAEWDATHKLRDDPRITPFGRFLRKSSLDELPQLLNVLRGEMSMIGPRPIINDEIAQYEDHFCDYARTRPGLSGLWQVSGRSDVSFRERVRIDVSYVRNWTLAGDLLIIVRTVPAILMRRGSY
jgi:exopolysaccharide production protein ExoY